MSLVIELPRNIEARLQVEAKKAGVSTIEYAAEVLTKSLPADAIDIVEQKRLNAASVTLLQSWLLRRHVPATSEQQALSEADLSEFMYNMNKSRKNSGERLLYPEIEVQQRKDQGKE